VEKKSVFIVARIRVDVMVPRKEPLESTIQIAVMDFIRAIKLDHITWHTPNGGRMPAHRGEKLRRLGVLAGVSDIFMARASRQYHGLALELKTTKGRLSENQKSFLNNLLQEGYCSRKAHSIDEAIDTIKWYLQL